MRIEMIDFDNYVIFLNNVYLNKIDFNNKEEITKYIKKFIFSINYKLNINGFYKVYVFCNKKIGMFIKLIKIEDNLYVNNLDLRIIVNINCDFYYKTDNYYTIPSNCVVRYYDNNYYCLIDDNFNVIDCCEYGDYIFGDNLLKMLNNSIIL